jgi:hypothetical protein
VTTKLSQATLGVVVDHYNSFNRATPIAELDYFAAQPSFAEAISEAAFCRVRGKRLSHQRRIPRAVLGEARKRLLSNASLLGNARTFEELHADLEILIGSISGIGPLTLYDIALRVGAYRDKSPRLIFLHAGTRGGANVLGLDWQASTLRVEDLPAPLQQLTPREAEDVLCIYKGCFHSGDLSGLKADCGSSGRSSRRC